MIAGAVYLMLVGIFALAVGAIVRNTASGIATFAAIFFVIPPLLNIQPSSADRVAEQLAILVGEPARDRVDLVQ